MCVCVCVKGEITRVKLLQGKYWRGSQHLSAPKKNNPVIDYCQPSSTHASLRFSVKDLHFGTNFLYQKWELKNLIRHNICSQHSKFPMHRSATFQCFFVSWIFGTKTTFPCSNNEINCKLNPSASLQKLAQFKMLLRVCKLAVEKRVLSYN